MPEATVFDHHDDEYAAWIRTHRDGYVINCTRGTGVSDMRLHLATCETIFQERPVGDTWTGGSYIKVCDDERSVVERWSRKNKKVRPQECQSCNSNHSVGAHRNAPSPSTGFTVTTKGSRTFNDTPSMSQIAPDDRICRLATA